MIYRILHAVNTHFALAMFWLYVAAFAITLPFIFVFPPMPLLMVFLSVASLGIVVLVAKALAGVEHLMVRFMIRRGRCPHCRESNPPARRGQPWMCEHCGVQFESSGARIVETPIASS